MLKKLLLILGVATALTVPAVPAHADSGVMTFGEMSQIYLTQSLSNVEGDTQYGCFCTGHIVDSWISNNGDFKWIAIRYNGLQIDDHGKVMYRDSVYHPDGWAARRKFYNTGSGWTEYVMPDPPA